jgi:hypothetical protein
MECNTKPLQFKRIQARSPPPVKLVRAVIREFKSICETYHIDETAYRIIAPVEIEGEWKQFDFLDSTEKGAAKIAIHSIVYNNNGEIYCRLFDF